MIITDNMIYIITVSTTRRIPTKHGYTVETFGNLQSGTSLQIEWQRLQEPWSENSGVLLYALFRKNKHRMDAISSRNHLCTGSIEAHHWKLQCFASGRGHFFGRTFPRAMRWLCCHGRCEKQKKRGFRWVLLDLVESEKDWKILLENTRAVHESSTLWNSEYDLHQKKEL